MPYLDQLLSFAMENRASDVHFSAGEPIRMRVDGDLVVIEGGSLESGQLEGLFSEILSEEEIEKLQRLKNLDKSHGVEGVGNFRVNIFYTKRGFASVIRSIPSKIPTMEQLGLPKVIQELCELPKGLVLVTGPTGSGKSTTLAAMINHINVNSPYHILTAEDPVEFVHTSKMSLVNQREIGHTCPTFADALKYALREDPDVILVGEMRDLETIGLALTAAETGHLVFGTLHTRGAGASVDRIIDSFPANQQAMVRAMLAESLQAVVSQALLKRKDGKGRVAAYEIMVVTPAISNLVREGKAFQIPSVIQTSRKDGMQLMSQHLRELITAGIITEEEAEPYLEESGGKKHPSKPTMAAKAPPPSIGPKVFVPKELTAHGFDLAAAKKGGAAKGEATPVAAKAAAKPATAPATPATPATKAVASAPKAAAAPAKAPPAPAPAKVAAPKPPATVAAPAVPTTKPPPMKAPPAPPKVASAPPPAPAAPTVKAPPPPPPPAPKAAAPPPPAPPAKAPGAPPAGFAPLKMEESPKAQKPMPPPPPKPPSAAESAPELPSEGPSMMSDPESPAADALEEIEISMSGNDGEPPEGLEALSEDFDADEPFKKAG